MNKKYVILIFIVIIYFAVMFLVFGLDKIAADKREATILLDNSSVFRLSNNKWTSINDSIQKKDFDWNKFNVFVNYQSIGQYYLWYDDKWYLFDEGRHPYIYDEGRFFAISANYEVKMAPISSGSISNTSYVDKVLEENSISNTEALTVKDIYSIDFDNDGLVEDFYVISNAFSTSSVINKVFNFVFMVKNGRITYLYREIFDGNDGQNGCKPYINTVVDLTSDNVYEIILSCSAFSVQDRLDMLYTYDKGTFKMLINNQ